ncbi:hypothetical protein Dimus_012351 [Dionaea muscipula]
MGFFSTCLPNSRRRKCSGRSTTLITRPLASHHQIRGGLQVARLSMYDYEKPTDPPRVPDHKRPTIPPSESQVKLNIGGRKRVTFDLNVKIYEEEELTTENVSGDVEKSSNEAIIMAQEEEEEEEDESATDNHCLSLFTSYPPNYRYGDCRDDDGDHEYDELLAEDSDIDDGHAESEVKKNDQVWATEEEESESLFSLSVDSRKQNLIILETGEKEEEVSSSPSPMAMAPIPLLNDLPRGGHSKENLNLAHWKARARQAAAAASISEYQAKENLKHYIDLNMLPTNEEESNLKSSTTHHGKKGGGGGSDQDMAVDTSLSSWLVVGGIQVNPDAKSESSVSIGYYSSPSPSPSQRTKMFEDRPILGALTVEEIRQFSASSSPIRWSPSRSRSPDHDMDMPIIGTVGSYWSDETAATADSFRGRESSITSKCIVIEDKKVIWNSIPFETRLEIALQKGSPEA